MKKLVLIAAMVMVLGMATMAQATLLDRGAALSGYHLIYDTDKDITWYDYTNGYGNWYNQMSWAENLTVTMADGRSFTDWRLPTTPGTMFGYTNEGEMGHLYYDELRNAAGGPLTNRAPFNNLEPLWYWTGSEVAAGTDDAWTFYFYDGVPERIYKDSDFCALAVRSGDTAAVPEPTTILLLGMGMAGVVIVRKWQRG